VEYRELENHIDSEGMLPWAFH